MRRWRHGHFPGEDMEGQGVIGEGFLVFGWGYFLAFPFKLKKIFILSIQREQELTGDTRLLGTGGGM